LTAEDGHFFGDIVQPFVTKRFFKRISCYADMTFQRIMESPLIAGDFAPAAKSPPITGIGGLLKPV